MPGKAKRATAVSAARTREIGTMSQPCRWAHKANFVRLNADLHERHSSANGDDYAPDWATTANNNRGG